MVKKLMDKERAKAREGEKGITIGVVGPSSSCGMVEKSLYEIDETLSVKCYTREQVNACGQVMDQCEQECDVILFTGCAVEGFLRETREIKKPYTSVGRSALSLANAFFEMERQNIELDAFSIDVVEHQVIEDMLDAFHILARNIYSCSFQPGVEEQDYVDWHISLQETGQTNVALTSMVWVYHMLRKKGYLAIYLGPTRAMVRLALERLKNAYVLNEAVYSQIAVEVLQLTNYTRSQDNYYSSIISKAEIEKEIVGYVELLQGAFFTFGEREYIVFSNAGIVRDKMNQQKLIRLQSSIRERGILLNVGIGTGVTANKAEMNAREALRYTLKQGRQEIFWIDHASAIQGPIGKDRQIKYELISSDPRILEITRKSGLSVSSVQKLISVAEARQSFIFDAHELAQCLDVTVRSARRIMNRVMGAGLGRIHAKEASAGGGRPKMLVEFDFKL